jgi:hypothetical protein
VVVPEKDLYTVFRPWADQNLFRLAESEDTAFFSNHDLQREPLRGEDAALHRGFSAQVSEELARKYVNLFDAPRRRGEPPRWNVILEFVLDPVAGHVVADTGRRGHFTVWGQDFRIERVIPI